MSPDKNVEAVRTKLLERSQVGLAKYEVTTERTDTDLVGWLNHLQEELMDAAVYVQRSMVEIEAARKDAEWISVDDRLPERYTEVMVWPHPSEQVMTAQFGLTHKESAPEWHYSEYISGFGWEEQICNPTHWKPLPAPPAIEQAKGK